jgi:hypothetical protein
MACVRCDDDIVDNVWVESSSRHVVSSISGSNDGGDDGGNSAVGSDYSDNRDSDDGSLGVDDDVCFLMRLYGMTSPPSFNLFVDTAALWAK